MVAGLQLAWRPLRKKIGGKPICGTVQADSPGVTNPEHELMPRERERLPSPKCRTRRGHGAWDREAAVIGARDWSRTVALGIGRFGPPIPLGQSSSDHGTGPGEMDGSVVRRTTGERVLGMNRGATLVRTCEVWVQGECA